jgi:hypothetical protein
MQPSFSIPPFGAISITFPHSHEPVFLVSSDESDLPAGFETVPMLRPECAGLRM